MASVTVDMRDLRDLEGMLDAASQRGVLASILDEVGAAAEDGARERIKDTKRGPSGMAWAPWSKRYARTREPHHSLLENKGPLNQDMTHNLTGPLSVEAGSVLVYAAAMQFGDFERNIPARPYLGIGDSERDAFDDIVEAWTEELFSA